MQLAFYFIKNNIAAFSFAVLCILILIFFALFYAYKKNIKDNKNVIKFLSVIVFILSFISLSVIYIFLYTISSIDGVYTSKETIIDGTYTFTGYYYLVTTATNNQNIKKILYFILSDEVKYLTEKTGYTPLN